jgi:WD40 repeat protein
MNDQTQPQNQDAVLGGQAPPTGVVLGGLDGIKQQLASGVWNQQLSAAGKAIQYGEVGLDLLTSILKQEKLSQVHWAAYFALAPVGEPEIQTLVTQHCPYRSFRKLFTLKGRFTFAISPDSQHLVTYDTGSEGWFRESEKLKVWDLKTGNLLRSFRLGSTSTTREISASAITVSPDGSHYFFGHPTYWEIPRVHVRSLSTGEIIETLQGREASDPTHSITLSQDGRYLAVGTESGFVEVWNLETRQFYFFKHGERTRVRFSPDGHYLVTESLKVLKVWRRATGELLHTLSWAKEKEVRDGDIAFHINSIEKTIISVSARGMIHQWNLETGTQLLSSQLRATPPKLPIQAAFSQDGQVLLLLDGSSQAEFWHWSTGKLLHSLQVDQRSYFNSVRFSSNGQFIVIYGSMETNRRRNQEPIYESSIQVWGMPSDSEGP